MFCQKCGTQNPDNGRFCRACGNNLGNVSAAISGNPALQLLQQMQSASSVEDDVRLKSNDPDELWSSGIRGVIMGVGFLIMAMVLLTTGVAGGRFWWWTMLFPAFPMLGNGISQISKSRRIAKRNQNARNQMPNFQTARNIAPAPENLLYIEQMIKDGRKIEAVKLYRETFGGDLEEAKDTVEKISAGDAPANFHSPDERVKPQKSIYDTGELAAPPSITEGTTRHLEINNEGETMTLPKK